MPRTILITGVSRGLGRSLAEGFVQLGHRVIGCSRDSDAFQSLKTQVGSRCDLRAVDVTSETQVSLWAADILQRYGAPDLLLNNAAVINRNEKLWRISETEFSELMEINVGGVVRVLRHFVPAMLLQRRGVIVNFSSGWGRSVSAEVAPYCASKWAIEGLTLALAKELPSGMCAVPLNPGVINTEMLQSCLGGGAEDFPGPAEWSARAIPFLLGLDGTKNGHQITVPD